MLILAVSAENSDRFDKCVSGAFSRFWWDGIGLFLGVVLGGWGYLALPAHHVFEQDIPHVLEWDKITTGNTIA